MRGNRTERTHGAIAEDAEEYATIFRALGPSTASLGDAFRYNGWGEPATSSVPESPIVTLGIAITAASVALMYWRVTRELQRRPAGRAARWLALALLIAWAGAATLWVARAVPAVVVVGVTIAWLVFVAAGHRLAGPRQEDLDRRRLGDIVAELGVTAERSDLTAAEVQGILAQAAALDRFRTAETAEFIDLVQPTFGTGRLVDQAGKSFLPGTPASSSSGTSCS